jgi:hypothetical protein
VATRIVVHPREEESIVIGRPPAAVFEFVMTPENDLLWSSTAVERSVDLDEPIGVGSRIRAVDKFLGRRIGTVFEETEHDPPRRSAIRLDRPFAASGTYVLDPVGSGTRFRWLLEAEPGLGGLYLGRLTDTLVRGIFRLRLRRDLARLKGILEQRNTAAS